MGTIGEGNFLYSEDKNWGWEAELQAYGAFVSLLVLYLKDENKKEHAVLQSLASGVEGTGKGDGIVSQGRK